MDAPSDTTPKATGVTRESARWATTVRPVRRLRARLGSTQLGPTARTPLRGVACSKARDTRRQADVVLLLGVGAVVVLAAVLRLVHVGAHLPGLVTPDEPTVMD